MFRNEIQLNTVLRLIFVQLCIKQVAKIITLSALAERFNCSVTTVYNPSFRHAQSKKNKHLNVEHTTSFPTQIF